ncbi:beta galactosidase jelly roll domain-containing protein [Aurantibacillus circumpalustris]|uniref:beta galactosidase jelly roll domain-containing protein n=1 Tax=Aurantibacillus circumpalustris TaxID=3036359 RepID=UPI00295B93FF|nr:beta galactosidase jelly roll domain-containing protein [Aurantibacillus circumpalustris]
MKKRLIYVVLAALVFLSTKFLAQTYVIDLRTGIDDGTQTQIPMGSFDDTWEVSPANSPGAHPATCIYQKVKIGNGTYLNGGSVTAYPGLCHNSGWLSPYLDPGGGGFDVSQTPQGVYYYCTTFNLFSCDVQQTVLKITCSQARYGLVSIWINNTVVHSLSVPYPNTFGNLNLIINTGGLLTQGQNTIYIRVWDNNYDSQTSGLQIEGDLTINTCAHADIYLNDKDGNKKDVFCIDEDVFVNAWGSIPGNYKLELQKETGGIYSQEAITNDIIGTPNGVSIKKIFENQLFYVFQPGVNYRVNVIVNGQCGTFNVFKDFSFTCCNNSPNASFSLNQTGSSLIGQSLTSGTHAWSIYKTDPLTQVVSSDGFTIFGDQNNFSYDLEGPCYYVSHTVTNDCGTSCVGQRFCNFNCEDKVCNLEAPVADYDEATKVVTWTGVTGAFGYVVQIIKDGCTPGGTLSISDVTNIDVQNGTSHTFNLFGPYEGSGSPPQNYLVKVFAKCPDGSLSGASNSFCVYP